MGPGASLRFKFGTREGRPKTTTNPQPTPPRKWGNSPACHEHNRIQGRGQCVLSTCELHSCEFQRCPGTPLTGGMQCPCPAVIRGRGNRAQACGTPRHGGRIAGCAMAGAGEFWPGHAMRRPEMQCVRQTSSRANPSATAPLTPRVGDFQHSGFRHGPGLALQARLGASVTAGCGPTAPCRQCQWAERSGRLRQAAETRMPSPQLRLREPPMNHWRLTSSLTVGDCVRPLPPVGPERLLALAPALQSACREQASAARPTRSACPQTTPAPSAEHPCR